MLNMHKTLHASRKKNRITDVMKREAIDRDQKSLFFIESDKMDEGFGILQTLTLQTSEITSCDFNNNYLLAIGSSDKKLRVLEWKIGLGFVDMSYSPISSHKYGITSVKFSPKGVLLASSSLDGTAELYNVQTGLKLFTMVQSNMCGIRQCEFTKDSTKLITAGDDGVFCFWDLVHYSQIRSCQLHEEEDFCVKGFSVAPESNYLFSIDSKGWIKLWFIGKISVQKPKCILTEKNFHGDIFGCDFLPVKYFEGGPHIKYKYFIATCGADGEIIIWKAIIERLQKNEECFKCDLSIFLNLIGHTNDVFSIKFNNRGDYLASASLDGTAKLWQVSTGMCLKTFEGHTRFVTCAVFSPDSAFLATGSNDKSLIVWNIKNNSTIDSELLNNCNVSSHFTNTDLINHWIEHTEDDQPQKNTFNHFTVFQKINFLSTVNSVYFYGSNLLVTGGREKKLTIWRKEKKSRFYQPKEELEEYKYSINHVEVSPCGDRLISCSMDEIMLLWDLNTGLTYKMRASSCTSGLRTCRFSPNSKFIAAAGDDQAVFLWDACNLEFLKTIQQHEDTITSLVFTSDSKFLISTCYTGKIYLYSFDDDKTIMALNNAHDLGVMCCDVLSSNAFSSSELFFGNEKQQQNDIYLLATGGNDSLVKLWQVTRSDIKVLNTLPGHGGTINFLRFSTREPYVLASCSADTTVRIWDAKSGLHLQVLKVHENAVTSCSFSHDSTLLVTGSLDKTVLIWSLTQRFCAKSIEELENFCKALENWTKTDIATWFTNIGHSEIAKKIIKSILNGRDILCLSDKSIMDKISLEKREEEKLKMLLNWLRKESNWNNTIAKVTKNIPHKFLCPVTHSIMRYPVICSDGFTYDRASIIEWFLGGKIASPMTGEYLRSLKLLPNVPLKKNIREFLFEENKV